MLPAGSRLTRREDFAAVLRRGRRSGRERLVVHLQIMSDPRASFATSSVVDGSVVNRAVVNRADVDGVDMDGAAPRAGFVVSKAVGGSVVRKRVVRRLRHLAADRLADLPAESRLVVRALPPAATASSAELAGDLDAALRGVLRKFAGSSQVAGGSVVARGSMVTGRSR